MRVSFGIPGEHSLNDTFRTKIFESIINIREAGMELGRSSVYFSRDYHSQLNYQHQRTNWIMCWARLGELSTPSCPINYNQRRINACEPQYLAIRFPDNE